MADPGMREHRVACHDGRVDPTCIECRAVLAATSSQVMIEELVGRGVLTVEEWGERRVEPLPWCGNNVYLQADGRVLDERGCDITHEYHRWIDQAPQYRRYVTEKEEIT